MYERDIEISEKFTPGGQAKAKTFLRGDQLSDKHPRMKATPADDYFEVCCLHRTTTTVVCTITSGV